MTEPFGNQDRARGSGMTHNDEAACDARHGCEHHDADHDHRDDRGPAAAVAETSTGG
jgi:hypothetical protein